MSKLAILLAITAIIFLPSCKSVKNVQKSETEKESVVKVDSAGTIKNDIEKESKIVTETKEVVDSTAFVTPDGKLISDPKEVTKESIKVPIKKTKTTKKTEEVKETDKSKSEATVKKKSEKEEKVVTKDKEVKKTGFIPWWIYLILAMCLAAYLVWRFYLRRS